MDILFLQQSVRFNRHILKLRTLVMDITDREIDDCAGVYSPTEVQMHAMSDKAHAASKPFSNIDWTVLP